MTKTVTIQRARQELGNKVAHMSDFALEQLIDSLYSVTRILVREVRDKKRSDILPRLQS